MKLQIAAHVPRLRGLPGRQEDARIERRGDKGRMGRHPGLSKRTSAGPAWGLRITLGRRMTRPWLCLTTSANHASGPAGWQAFRSDNKVRIRVLSCLTVSRSSGAVSTKRIFGQLEGLSFSGDFRASQLVLFLWLRLIVSRDWGQSP